MSSRQALNLQGKYSAATPQLSSNYTVAEKSSVLNRFRSRLRISIMPVFETRLLQAHSLNPLFKKEHRHEILYRFLHIIESRRRAVVAGGRAGATAARTGGASSRPQ